jgi:TolB-like protein/DNA-binding winged helix-turn-helix (wHTH) protein/Tfp pilus assembly protein PilF
MDAQAKSFPNYQFGPYRVDVAAGQLRKHGTRIRLAGQPFDILVMLLERAGQVVTREEINQRLWSNETFVDFENSLNKAINKLRQALADSPEQPIYIETLPRRGYRFIAPINGSASELVSPQVSHQGTDSAAEARKDSAGPQSASRTAAPEVKARQPVRRAARPSQWLVYGLGSIALAVCVLFAANLWLKRDSNKSITSVAVLPLEYLSNEPGQEYFADGVTDELITQLAKSGAFRVTSRTSSMQFKKSNKSIRQIAGELGVEALIEGSIERVDGRVRIRAQLIRASTDQYLWAESYDGAERDLLSLEDRVAREVALQVAVNLTSAQERRFVRARTVNPDAYLDYLRGRFFWNQRTPDGFEKALRYFQAAIDKDPNYAAAYAGLADTYLLLGGYEFRSQNEMIPKAREAAQKALAMENLSEAHATLGLIAENYDWDWPNAEKEFRLAIELNPNYSTAHHWYGEAFLAATGRFDEALVEMKRAAELDPLSPIISTDVGATLYLARRYDQAIHQLTRTLELYPDDEGAQIWLARSYEQKKQCTEAVSVFDNNKTSLETLLKKEDRARIYAECGRKADSLRILDDLQRQASTRFVDPALPGFIFIGLGRRNEALTQLEKSVSVHSVALTSLRVLPIYDPLRSDPRFAALLKTAHLSE